MKLIFYGAAGGNVVPSRFLLQGKTPEESALVDCGDIIPDKKNKHYETVFTPLDPRRVGKVLFTHGHTDHVGASCDFVEQGYNGEFVSTRPTKEITKALLQDNFTKGKVDDVFELYGPPRDFLAPFEISEGVRATFYPAQGHILGASSILFELKNGLRVLFSGDLGNTNKTMLEVTGEVPEADIVIIESTYGKREHHPDFSESLDELYEGINETYHKDGDFYIPVLSINKLQEALFYLNHGIENGLAPRDINTVVDSSLGEVITGIYDRDNNRQFYSASAKQFFSRHSNVYPFEYTTHINEGGRNIILASSGLDGLRGRFKNHLNGLSSGKNSMAIVSHTLEGSLLDNISSGKKKIRARSFTLSGFSSHADATQLVAWLEKTKAKYVFLVHGENDSREKLKQMITQKGICSEKNIFLPTMNEEVDLYNLQGTHNTVSIPPINNGSQASSDNGKTFTLWGNRLNFSTPI